MDTLFAFEAQSQSFFFFILQCKWKQECIYVVDKSKNKDQNYTRYRKR